MTRRYLVAMAGKERRVEVETQDDGSVRVVVDGRERFVDARRIGAGAWSLIDGASSRLFQVDGVLPKLSVAVNGVVASVEVTVDTGRSVASAAERAAADKGPSTIKAPIPGRVVKCLVRAGDSVSAGQGVIVVEAMKMENELRAVRAGVVKEMRCAEGDAVETGQVLALLD